MWVWVKMKRPRNGWSDATCDQEIICKYSFETKPIYEDVWPAQMWGYQVVVKQNIIEETWIQRFPVTWYCSKETRIWCSFKGILIGFQGYFFFGISRGPDGISGVYTLGTITPSLTSRWPKGYPKPLKKNLCGLLILSQGQGNVWTICTVYPFQI